MTLAPLSNHPERLAAPAPGPQPSDALLLVRQAHGQMRAAPHRSPEEACALVSPAADAATYARALAQALPSLLGHRPVIRSPGTQARSFDEAWLVALEAALKRRDADSLRFLTARRLSRGGAEICLFLLRGLVERLGG